MGRERSARTLVLGTAGDAAAAAELRRLLLEVPEYRLRWLRHVQRRRNGTISHSAVARALSSVDTCGASLESLRDRSRRALSGEVLTPPTLRLFAEAFGFTLAEQERLWTLLGSAASTVDGRSVSTPGPETPPAVATLSHAVDVHLGADRRSWTARTTLTVQAVTDGVDHLPLGLGDHRVSPLLGCRVERVTGGHVVRFPRALRAGDLHVYAIVERGTELPDRYVVTLPCPTALLAVQVGFTPPALPARVWWRRSPDPSTADPPAHEEVLPGPAHRVSWTQQDLAAGRYGFTWVWGDGLSRSSAPR